MPVAPAGRPGRLACPARPGPGDAGRRRGPPRPGGASPTTPCRRRTYWRFAPGSPPALGDLRAERRALEQLVAIAPGRFGALDRLAGLAKQAGDEAEAARLRGRKAELDRIVERYRERLFKPDPAAAAEELAGHAESLGRLFEARAWWELAVSRGLVPRSRSEAALERLARAEADRRGAATLAEVLAELGPATDPPRGGTAAASTGPAPAFTDDAEAVGLRFRYDAGASKERQIPETMGTGLGLLDYLPAKHSGPRWHLNQTTSGSLKGRPRLPEPRVAGTMRSRCCAAPRRSTHTVPTTHAGWRSSTPR